MFTCNISSFKNALTKDVFSYLFKDCMVITLYCNKQVQWFLNLFFISLILQFPEEVFILKGSLHSLHQNNFFTKFDCFLFGTRFAMYLILGFFLIISNWAIKVTQKVTAKSCQIFSNPLARKNCEDNIFRYFIYKWMSATTIFEFDLFQPS